ncbi:uncharacterized protein PADG_06443 [Paracoccidioides brasiliensis Pb18]|uniref:Uncharacterized protein n=1 Tax=Paracoccidioides brasiliensis (strain Pb18) TaxID=502780 RepID=C1GGK6_PARBD|nr:uncharacterized protein PADG_06443 [Paracoccidioides brasiliensis Pb18]EEH50364.1 hypothetical protein PADG_06443 [Paracoccidioides brasiliensis Pb18]
MSPFHSGAWKDGRSLEVEAEGRLIIPNRKLLSSTMKISVGLVTVIARLSILASLSDIPGETQVVETAGEN